MLVIRTFAFLKTLRTSPTKPKIFRKNQLKKLKKPAKIKRILMKSSSLLKKKSPQKRKSRKSRYQSQNPSQWITAT
jgi:hypothetical protein